MGLTSRAQDSYQVSVNTLNNSDCSTNDGRIAIGVLTDNAICQEVVTKKRIAFSDSEILDFVIADFHNDNLDDVVYSNGNSLILLKNEGAEIFVENILDDSITNINTLAFGDIDSDGNKDLIARSSTKLFWFKNNGVSFEKIEILPSNAYTYFSISDYDGDGITDILAASNSSVRLLVNDGNENFTNTALASISDNIESIDWNGDGFLDFLEYGDETVEIHQNDGNGNFTKSELYDTFVYDVKDIAVTDHEGDGDMDFFTLNEASNYSSNGISLILNNGNGTFSRTFVYEERWNFLDKLIPGDINNDGSMDVIAGATPTNTKYINDGNGTFTRSLLLDHDETTQEFKLLDIDNALKNVPLYRSENELFWFKSECLVENQNSKFEYSINGGATFQDDGLFSGLPTGSYNIRVRNLVNSEVQDYSGNPVLIEASKIVINEVDTTDSRYCDNGTGSINISAEFPLRKDNVFGEKVKIGNFASYYVDLDFDGNIDVLGIDNGANVNSQIFWYKNHGTGGFTKQRIYSRGTQDEINHLYTVDIDNDNDLDIIIDVEGGDDENILINDGNQTFTRYNLEIIGFYDRLTPISADMDGDGDIDLLARSTGYQQMAWHENTGDRGSGGSYAFTRHQIFDIIGEITQIHPEDMDGDGDIDLIVSTKYNGSWDVVGGLFFFENDGNQNFTENIIFTGANVEEITIDDFDFDSDLDIVYTSSGKNEINVALNDGNENFTDQLVSGQAGYGLFVRDIDLDGNKDIITVQRGSAFQEPNKIKWFKNNGIGSYEQNTIYEGATYLETFLIANDIDKDGDIDILKNGDYYLNETTFELNSSPLTYSIDDGITFNAGASFQNLNPGEYNIQVKYKDCIEVYPDNPISISGRYPISIEDVQSTAPTSPNVNDGTITITSSAEDVEYCGEFDDEELLNIDQLIPSLKSSIIDYDNDGLLDVIASQNQEVVWFKKYDNGLFYKRNVTGERVYDYAIADFNNDNRLDVVARPYNDSGISWYENVGESNHRKTLLRDGIGLSRLYVADLNKDGNMDVVAVYQNNFQLLINDGNGNFDLRTSRIGNRDTITNIAFDDINSDGDLDIIASSGSWIATYLNDGSLNFVEETKILNYTNNQKLFIEDIDGDGFLDIFSQNENNTDWYQNDGQGGFVRINGNTAQFAYRNAQMIDIDTDGSVDILLDYSENGIDERRWIKNQGQGSFEEPVTIHQHDEGLDNSILYDFDGDSDIDILSINANTLKFYKNKCNEDVTTLLSYSIDGGATFQDSNIFSNLSHNIEYNVVVKGDNNDCQLVEYGENPILFLNSDDKDGDGIKDDVDNCPDLANPNQEDEDGNGVGDICEPIQVSSTLTSISCSGMTDAIIELTAEGGLAPYTYQLLDSNNAIIRSQQETMFNNLPAGIFITKVVDTNSQEAFGDTITIVEPEFLALEIIKTDVSCKGSNDGQVQLTATGGTAPYEFSIDGSTYVTNNSFSSLIPSTIEVFVRDANGCTQLSSITIAEPDTPDFDNDGLGDSCDPDIDGDGIDNDDDICSETPAESSVGTDGCIPEPDVDSNVLVYPNPIDIGNITIQIPESYTGNAQLFLFSNIGSLASSQSLEVANGIIEFNMDGWASGVYSIKVETPENSYNQRIIKK
ncbi:FG-GAP-like repeat-containing protein [Pseudozobellia sp. WGM2]|uniref:FG-GAP-like repeat-containing protein n=1 Tax=Pseudozobellia sp. WGM2 TaxID=2787625 RepID=UPI001AE0AB37|nr:FG-GAP-like repeat-containing protein [Pseudozobellia sp. WGM2]